MDYFQNEDTISTIQDHCDKMSKYLAGVEPYGKKNMKKKLKELFGPDLFFLNYKSGATGDVIYRKKS